jgi:hypothetical protein
MVRKMMIVSAIMLVLLMLNCGGGGGESSSEAQQPKEEQPAPSKGTDISMYTASVSGAVHFKGEAPKARPIKMDAECGAFHSEPAMNETMVINANGTCKWVFVYVKEGLGDKKFDPPSEPVVFDQVGCTYKPHVFGVQTGRPIKILNSDPLLHNIHSLPEINRPFNFGMPKKGDEREQSFKKAEVMVKIKCDVHPWMGAYCGVVDHPYFVVTGDDGSFTIKNLPAGEYVLEAWHEEFGTQTKTVKVGDNETAAADFTFGPTS